MPRIATAKKVWFDLPGDPDNGRVELRHLKDGDVQETLNRINVTESVYQGKGKPAMTRVRQTESAAIALAAAAITDWENHLDENGNTLACDADNVRRFLKEDGYLSAITKLSAELSEMVNAEKEAAEKNG